MAAIDAVVAKAKEEVGEVTWKPYIYGILPHVPYIYCLLCRMYNHIFIYTQEAVAAIDAAVAKAKEEVGEVKALKELDSMLAVAAETGPVCP